MIKMSKKMETCNGINKLSIIFGRYPVNSSLFFMMRFYSNLHKKRGLSFKINKKKI